jgi:hypothetical protein
MSTYQFFLDASELRLGCRDRPVFREVTVGDHLHVFWHNRPREMRKLYFFHCSLCSLRLSVWLPRQKLKKMIKEEKIQVFQIKGFDFYKLLNGKGRRS